MIGLFSFQSSRHIGILMVRFGHVKCPECKRIFVFASEYEDCCSLDCLSLKKEMVAPGGKIQIKSCIHCSKPFKQRVLYKVSATSRICSEECRVDRARAKKFEDVIENANRRFLEGKKIGGKKIPLDVLNRLMERKRVWDDAGWDHYLTGKKWDKI
jgi:hypothetical protein